MESKIRKMKIDITNQCPLCCVHCSSSASPSGEIEIATHFIFRVITEFKEMGGQKITISGGEPLTHPDLCKILSHARTLGLHVTLYTTGIREVRNGIARPVENELLESITQYLDRIIFSVFGDDKKSHEGITKVPGSFESTWSSISRSIRIGLDTQIHFVPTSQNYKSLPNITKNGEQIGVKCISILRFVPQGRGKEAAHEIRMKRKELISLKRIIRELQAEHKKILIRTGSPFNILLPKETTPCRAAIDRLFITAEGNIHPCDAFKRYEFFDKTLDSIYKGSLNEIWLNSPYLNTTRQALKEPYCLKCSACRELNSCQAGCLAQKVIKYHSFSQQSDPECIIN